MRRDAPLLVSDYRFEPVGPQGHNYDISSWIPFHGAGVSPSSPHVMRSHFRPSYAYGGMNQDPKMRLSDLHPHGQGMAADRG
jgi:hypothetical protein